MVSNWILKLWIISALIDSTCLKVSNDILFVIFRAIVWKLWFLQDPAEFWFKIPIEIFFKPGPDTWRVLIRRYRFGWIDDLGCRIKRRLSGSDLKIPVRLSHLSGTIGSWSGGQERSERGEAHLRFTVDAGGVVCALVVVLGGAAEIPGGYGDHDVVR
jgi:hypothetical protein